ncbi:hypothetical protein N7526_005918 [Penicillium atrosanguineum]|nr:hypothetical protein N7526_005918 [Penicillium atrosanguineum]
MPTKNPAQSDFPSKLTLTVTLPPSGSSPAPNYKGLHPSPLDLGGFHWGDDVAFDTSSGGLDMDAGLTRSTAVLANDVVRDTLIKKCGYLLREIMIFGFGQGGMAALTAARELGQGDNGGPLSGVISVGAPYPLSGQKWGPKNRTPVLLVAGRDSLVVSDAAVRRTKEVFEFVELSRYPRKGDSMPSNRNEMMPVMQFFARRLRSRQGVPEAAWRLADMSATKLAHPWDV